MFRSENYKFRAKTLKANEAVSGYDTARMHFRGQTEQAARRHEKFAAGICNLQQKDSFSEVPIFIKVYFRQSRYNVKP